MTTIASVPSPTRSADGASSVTMRARAARQRLDGGGASVACVRRRTCWRARDVGVSRELEEHPARRVVRALAVLEIGQYLAYR